jgi:5-methylcytosine-specific restriction endonuclease McrA
MFEYPEDKQFFADLLTDGDVNLLEHAYSDLFDFRHHAIKRWEFGKVRKKILQDLIEKHHGVCQLGIHPQCSSESRLEPDHIIPLASNVLNKKLRKLPAPKGMKVLSQNFGSNHPRNLTLACRKCNGLKKHRILSGAILLKLIV